MILIESSSSLTIEQSDVISKFPNPAENPAACGRASILEFGGHGSQICDPLNLMDTDGKDSLEGIIVIAQEKLNEVNQPIVFAVVLVDKIPSSFVTGGNIDLATEKFARGLMMSGN